MNKFKTFSIALLASVTASYAQDIDQAKKAIDAEQFEKAKSMLKTIIQSKPANGKAAFLLGNVYLTQNIADSAKIYFQKGLSASEDSKFNYIGLGQMDLDNGNLAAAQANFAMATKDIKKKDVEPYVYVGKAYLNANKPDYKNALTVLGKAKLINPQDAQLQLVLGDAYYGDKNQNDAYVAYRTAFQSDPTLIRAKMQQAVLLKGAKAYSEATKLLNEIVATNPNYGPVYRELAETYFYWGNNDPKNYKEYIQKALGYYEKYMSMTDYSLTSRMRHADFLIVAKDYAALEVEANKMKELDNVNPRILRYLGYSAYENGNIDAAIQALESFIANPTNKIIARDYLYLGLAKLRNASNPETKKVDQVAFDAAVSNIKKAVEMEITMTNDLNEVGKKFYELKMFKEAAAIYEIAVTNPDSRNYLLDNFYLGNSLYYDNNRKDVVKPDPIALQKADAAFANVITASPATQDAYIFRARTNSLLEKPDLMVKFYEEYIKVVSEKGAEEIAKPATKAKLIEAYNTIAGNSEKAKAKEYLAKTLALDPTNKYALDLLKSLK
ncbi:tetratricopeptide repeat protein [Flavobacterium sp.]|uniref:tetratricopeptide repeat protein n=1 Tax=Flavobacterium sp. TaxID=239 RepID=UPI002B4B89B9|nr:tetratricopeptide repeat protein [Flavobacterium sp.]HLF52969.1 tetratricopeptide repeat protein [Flavobacterium sp.]